MQYHFAIELQDFFINFVPLKWLRTVLSVVILVFKGNGSNHWYY